MFKSVLLCVAFLFSAAPAFAATNYECEKETKDGKHEIVKDVKSKRKCEKAGGKWVKQGDHAGHDHAHDDGEKED